MKDFKLRKLAGMDINTQVKEDELCKAARWSSEYKNR
jgi:hypothetical protein